jgi:hypothetical protein
MNEHTHDLAEMETACADGLCPICLSAELAAKNEQIADLQIAVTALQRENIKLMRAQRANPQKRDAKNPPV